MDDVDAETATTLNVEPARTAVETITTAYVDPNEGDPSDLVRDSSIPRVEEVSAAVETASASLCVTIPHRRHEAVASVPGVGGATGFIPSPRVGRCMIDKRKRRMVIASSSSAILDWSLRPMIKRSPSFGQSITVTSNVSSHR
ncbi:hypothetical protein CV102_21970 [Natronococcus pandeyae]|uniref:Uncharacterized protein n=1 Tax=Natronococcus pandeyae TaxID=2055836 RepID=A0A8J8Q2G3_9EURY|nr:hypothetical protein CV102_21970 [Natronococcus pandeyae]